MIRVMHYQSGGCHVYVDQASMDEFKELVHRATNLWPDASPEIKAFADQITNNGVLMQDYTKPEVTAQPKFCSYLLTTCRFKCKGASCTIKNQSK